MKILSEFENEIVMEMLDQRLAAYGDSELRKKSEINAIDTIILEF